MTRHRTMARRRHMTVVEKLPVLKKLYTTPVLLTRDSLASAMRGHGCCDIEPTPPPFDQRF